MDVVLRFWKLNEQTIVEFLNTLARHNVAVLMGVGGHLLPLLYESGVIYRREAVELFSDYPSLLRAGHEDCDALAAARAAELVVRGWRALNPGCAGYREAQRLRPASIPAVVHVTTRSGEGEGKKTYHCIVRYQIGGKWYRDDPSLRLGMANGKIDAAVLALWRKSGVRARAPMEIRS